MIKPDWKLYQAPLCSLLDSIWGNFKLPDGCNFTCPLDLVIKVDVGDCGIGENDRKLNKPKRSPRL